MFTVSYDEFSSVINTIQENKKSSGLNDTDVGDWHSVDGKVFEKSTGNVDYRVEIKETEDGFILCFFKDEDFGEEL